MRQCISKQRWPEAHVFRASPRGMLWGPYKKGISAPPALKPFIYKGSGGACLQTPYPHGVAGRLFSATYRRPKKTARPWARRVVGTSGRCGVCRSRRFRRCRWSMPSCRLCPSSWCGRIRRAACRCAHRCARRSSHAAPATDWPAVRRCDTGRKRPARY